MAVLAKPLPREASEALNVLTPTKGSAEFECLEVFFVAWGFRVCD